MYILQIVSQYRRDFTAIYKCQHCDNTCEGPGYDDMNFHKNVVPIMLCPKCDKIAPEDYRPLTTKYPEDKTV